MTSTTAASERDLALVDVAWRAANYLTIGRDWTWTD
jgi:hypothetical protein